MEFATTEYEKDKIVVRLKDGFDAKRKASKRVGQHGQRKLNGRNTTLDKMKLTAKQRRDLKSTFEKHDAGAFGVRPLAIKISKILKKRKIIGHMTAARMKKELKHKFS